jgi:O-antigen ligase
LIKTFFYTYRVQLALFLAVLIIGFVASVHKEVVLYGYVKIIELILFGFGAKTVMQKEEKGSLKNIAAVFAVGVLISSVIALAQFLRQSSVGGLLYLIGERAFSSETPGIANASINGALLLRPYAAFPHPNVLAWYLLVGTLICVTALFLKRDKTPNPFMQALLILAVPLGATGIILTFSRSVIVCLVLFILLSPFFFLKKVKKEMLVGFYACAAVLIIGSFFLTPIGGRMQALFQKDKAIAERQQLFTAAQAMIKEAPISGIGVNNYLVRLPDFFPPPERRIFLQPVHNMYILTLVETGIIGLGLFLYVLWRALVAAGRVKDPVIRVLCSFLLIAALLLGAVDHYLLTLEQGQILFVFLIAMCFAYGSKKFPKN